MFFTPHDLIILDKISYEKLFVCMFSYNSVLHPVSLTREPGHSASFIWRWSFSEKNYLQSPKSPITIIRENIFSYLCIFTLICSFNQYYSLFLSRWIYQRFLPLLFLSTLHFSAFFFLSSMILPSYLHRWHLHILYTSEPSSKILGSSRILQLTLSVWYLSAVPGEHWDPVRISCSWQRATIECAKHGVSLNPIPPTAALPKQLQML